MPSASTGTATPLETEKGFDKDQIAKLKDACGVSDARAIPNIWFVIQSSKGKSYDSYRAHLAKSTNAWCQANHIKQDKSIYLPTNFFKDLVALQFNPGGLVAQYSSVAKIMSMLACRLVTAVEAKYQQGYEEAMDQTKGTRSLKELLKGNRGKVITPPPDYMQLKLNIGSYCAILWSIFGEQCDFYRKLLKIYRILDRKECFTIREAYTKEICARITWAIVDVGHSFFGRNPVASNFTAGARLQFSMLLLESITDAVRNALPIQRATFPKEWLTPTPSPLGQGGGEYQGGGGYQSPRQPAGPPLTNWPNPAPAITPALSGGPSPGGPRKQGGEDVQNPKIKTLMDPYLQKYNNYIDLSALLTASGKRFGDLPTLPQYWSPQGATFVC